ncbi:MAG: PD40 domain-containing protein [Planctomycetes bacterium]|nr:PD40 domain-containing protein [Planctomycetota bacterium]
MSRLLASLVLASAALAQTTTRVSVNSGGAPAIGDCQRYGPSVSADGRFVVFASDASNLDLRDGNGVPDVFLHDRSTVATEIVSLSRDGSVSPLMSGVGGAAISSSGRWIVFESSSSTIVPGDVNGTSDIFVFDRMTRSTVLVSVSTSGLQGNGPCASPSISSGGRFVAFSSASSNLVSPDANGVADVFVRDRDADGNGTFDEPGGATTVRASVSSSGIEGDAQSFDPAISADGSIVVFDSLATNLVPMDSNRTFDAFVHDLRTGGTSLVFERGGGSVARGTGVGSSIAPVSADGRWVVFFSDSAEIVAGDTNGTFDTFVRDSQSGGTERISVDSLGGGAIGGSTEGTISADGRYVAFRSAATNLVAGDTNMAIDLFVRDRQSSVTTRVSVSTAADQANGATLSASISGDGRVVVFTGAASNLVANDETGYVDAFARDWITFGVDRVVPSNGSESGGDLVQIVGRELAQATDVRFGGMPATVVESRRNRLTVRTPPGVGLVDVSLTSPIRTISLSGGFTYAPAELAARYGTVNVGRGERENVLLLDAVSGDPVTREVVVPTRRPLTLVMTSPSSRATARFAIYAWPGAPRATTIRTQPRDVGTTGFPTPNDAGMPQPIAIGNNLDSRLGTATFPTSRAPSVVGRTARGIRRPVTVTVQGFIQDAASASRVAVSVTNAIVLRVVP